MFDLKIDPKLPHYILSVGMRSIISPDAGKMFLKHGPIYFTNDDVEAVRGAAILAEDKLFKTSHEQALKNFDCLSLASSIRCIGLAAAANQCTVHHFSSEFKLADAWFVTLVDLANTSEHNKDLLKKSRMR